jgi:hypothetical protein
VARELLAKNANSSNSSSKQQPNGNHIHPRLSDIGKLAGGGCRLSTMVDILPSSAFPRRGRVAGMTNRDKKGQGGRSEYLAE